MHLQCDLANTVRSRELGGFLPVWDGNLVPLIVENLQEIWRPGTSYPIRSLIAGSTSRATAKGGDRVDPKLIGQADTALKGRMMRSSGLFVRMQRISMNGQTRDLQSSRDNRVEKILRFLRIFQQCFGLTMRAAGVGTGADLNRLHS